ncbi:MAG: ATPase domain-containing protein [Halobacteriales archaeon]|nr:ATPase domain-containing protein [Halobacteriales archaeon]
MDYELAVAGAPETVPGGTGILLLHPSTGETDRIDTDFLKLDTDAYFVISTRTTAREVQQKLEHFDVDQGKAVILDTLSVERGYSRRGSENIHYVSAPDDLDGIVAQTESFFESTDGKRRVSVDSITEMAYYADESRARRATEQLLELLEAYDAVGLFHLSPEVHDDDVLAEYEALFDGVIDLAEDGSITARF